jgi:DUF177 domain-containing protein
MCGWRSGMPRDAAGFTDHLHSALFSAPPRLRGTSGTVVAIIVAFYPASQDTFMFLSVKEMELRRLRFDETFQPGQIDFSGEALEQATPLHVTGSAELLAHSEGEVRIQGKYTVELTAECDRCLGSVRFPLDGGFDLFYRPVSVIAHEEEVEIREGEAGIGFYQNGGMELEDILREQVLLALPMQRVCSEACRGICPVCGVNRNEKSCDCRIESSDDRWGALRKLEL